MNADTLAATLIMLRFKKLSPKYNVFTSKNIEIHMYSKTRILIGPRNKHSYTYNWKIHNNIVKDILDYEKKNQ